jgi:hypothetical protein
MKKAIFAGCLAVILVLVTGAPGMTQTQNTQTQSMIRISEKLTLPMGMQLENVFDDNIYLGAGTNTTTEDVVEDSVFHIKPNIGINYDMPERGFVFAGFEGDWASYATEDQNNWQTNKGLFNLDYEAPAGLILGINELYADAADPYGDSTQFGLGRPQTERTYNDFNGQFGWNFGGTMKALAYYNNYFQDYKQEIDKTQNHKDQEFGVGVEYKGLGKTWIFARYHYGEVDWDGRPNPADPLVPPALGGLNDSNDADYQYHRINAGLTWDPGSKITGELNLGYQWNSFDNQFDLFGNPYVEKDTWIASTVINWQAQENTMIFASLLRAYRVANGFSNQYFEDTGIAAGVEHNFATKWTVEGLISWAEHEYNYNRKDDLFEGVARINYAIQEWLGVAAYYRYRERTSNIAVEEYDDNQIGLLADFQF